MQFYDGGSPIGSPVPLYFISANNDGYALYEAQYSTSFPTPGTHTITAQYAGDANYPVVGFQPADANCLRGQYDGRALLPSAELDFDQQQVNFKWLPGQGQPSTGLTSVRALVATTTIGRVPDHQQPGTCSEPCRPMAARFT